MDTLPEADITKLKAYSQVVSPVIQRLKSQVLDFGNEFEETAKSLTWSFVPAKLSPVNSNVNGVPIETDQAGVQIGDED